MFLGHGSDSIALAPFFRATGSVNHHALIRTSALAAVVVGLCNKLFCFFWFVFGMNACLLSKGMHVHVQVFSMQKRDLGENIIMSGRTLLHLQWFLFCFVCCCFSEKKKKKKKKLFWKSWTRCQPWNAYTYSDVLRKISCS